MNRLTPEETCFASLMFRSNELEKVQDEIGITYRTELLDSYKREFQKAIKEYERNTATTREKHLWNTRDFSPFLYESFIEKFKSEASILYENASPIFLPFITWQKMTKRYPINKNEDFTKTFIQDFLTSILY